MPLYLNGTDGVYGVNGTNTTPANRGSDTNTGIVYGTDTVQIATGGTTAVTVDSSQNVGIGTASPACRADIQATDARSILRLTATTATNPVYTRLSNTGGFFYIGRDGSAGTDFGAGAYASAIWSEGAYPLVFGTNAAERARIDSSGNLLVGTTNNNPYGNAVAGVAALSTGVLQTSAAGATVLLVNRNTNDGDLVEFGRAGVKKGSISVSGSTTAYNTSSDYRLKENIKPMQNALAVLVELKPVTFTWKIDGSDGQGFIAHELQATVPDCVTGEKDAVDADGNPVYQGVDTSFLVATLTAAIQELSAKLDAATARIAALEAK